MIICCICALAALTSSQSCLRCSSCSCIAIWRHLRPSSSTHSPRSQATLRLRHAFGQSEHAGLRRGPPGARALFLGVGSPPAAGA
eukprot:2263555-Pyramimonas_sp.AAC.1